MGKKSRNGKISRAQMKRRETNANINHNAHVDANARARIQRKRENYTAHALAKMAEMDQMTLQEQIRSIRATLMNDIGTNCEKNDSDPMGDGDQSPIRSKTMAEKARELYSIGGDIHAHLTEKGAVSKFVLACSTGNVASVCDAIHEVVGRIQTQQTKTPLSRCNELKQLLETRETSMRLSPLLFIVSAGKNLYPAAVSVSNNAVTNHVGVAKILLKYGASPDAKDVLGKTVCHYGAGMMANSMTLEVVDMCIRAARTSHLFGKDVELCGLKTTEMNGLRGVVGGFDPDTGRRSIFFTDAELDIAREVFVKPENIRLLATELDEVQEPKNLPMLADVQDRLGSVSLHEVVMQDRENVADFLLNKHRTSIHTEDLDGISPLKMSIGFDVMNTGACKMIMSAARKEGNASWKAKKRCGVCFNCGSQLGDGGHRCSGCNGAVYCGRGCQRRHWKNGHKEECCNLSAGVKVMPMRTGSGLLTQIVTSYATGKTHIFGSFRKPIGVKVNEKFLMKVQAKVSDMAPLLLYDESRTCEFSIGPASPGFKEILTETRKEIAWNGRKTFMKASFDDGGRCTVYPVTARVKEKYSW